MLKSKKRILEIKLLPGEPTDGTGRVVIHWFMRDPNSAFAEHCMMKQVKKDGSEEVQKELGTVHGRLACDPKLNIVPQVKNGVTYLVSRTDDVRAVTCPKCIAVDAYKKELEAANKSIDRIPTPGE